jgi:hypothetical protein
MNNAQMLAALAALPDPDMLTATKIDDPLGAGVYYRADTVVRILAKERKTCEMLRATVKELIGMYHSMACDTIPPLEHEKILKTAEKLVTPNV